jgi:hypothetical protein
MKIFRILFLIPVIALAFNQACDIVEEPYLVPIDTIGDEGTSDTIRKILLEDYTGHKCPNCPEAAEEAHNLKLLYGDQLVILTIHAGYYSTPDATGNFTYDFRTAVGGQVHDYYGFQFYPTGLVNRKEYNGNLIMIKAQWGNAVNALIDLPKQVDIDIVRNYNPTSRELTVTTGTEFLEALDGTYYICVFITESLIIKPQQSETGVIQDYEHNHVLRTSMNGTWGDLTGGEGTGETGKVFSNQYSITLDDEWVSENCGIIVFVYDNDSPTREVLQVEEMEVVE